MRADRKVSVEHKEKYTVDGETLGVLLRQLWLYTRLAPLGRLLLQEAFILLMASFTGTRPAFLVPRKRQHQTPKQRPSKVEFVSDLPQLAIYDHLPACLSYQDIELSLLANREENSTIPIAIIHFRNLKGKGPGHAG